MIHRTYTFDTVIIAMLSLTSDTYEYVIIVMYSWWSIIFSLFIFIFFLLFFEKLNVLSQDANLELQIWQY